MRVRKCEIKMCFAAAASGRDGVREGGREGGREAERMWRV
jgi:hypothetical protein